MIILFPDKNKLDSKLSALYKCLCNYKVIFSTERIVNYKISTNVKPEKRQGFYFLLKEISF